MSRAEFSPRPSEATRAYWEATRERRLLLQWCPRCASYVHHPREACPRCLTRALEWRESAGTGTVHAASVHHRPFEAMGPEDCPYVVAFVDLDDGVRFLSNVVTDEPEAVAAGQRVELAWAPVAEGFALPVFRRPRP